MSRVSAATAVCQARQWAKVQARLEAKSDKLWSLAEMERTGGELDVVRVKSGEFVFMDCAEKPGRLALVGVVGSLPWGLASLRLKLRGAAPEVVENGLRDFIQH